MTADACGPNSPRRRATCFTRSAPRLLTGWTPTTGLSRRSAPRIWWPATGRYAPTDLEDPTPQSIFVEGRLR